MPFDEVMGKFKAGQLHSGSKQGPPVKNRSQAIAIMLAEKKKADSGDPEYQSTDSQPPSKGPKKGSKPLAGLKKAAPKKADPDHDMDGC